MKENKLKITFFILMIAIICSCSSGMPKEVNIPIITSSPKIDVPKKPYLPIASLTKDSKPDVVVKSYVASIKILQGDDDSLRKIISGYNA